MDQGGKMIECTDYRPINKNTLLGYATIYVPKWDLDLYDIAYCQKDGRRWVNFPSKVYAKDGETKYSSYYRFRERINYDKFCKSIKEAIEKKIELDNIAKCTDGGIVEQSTSGANEIKAFDDQEVPF
jgi:hypothetical protein